MMTHAENTCKSALITGATGFIGSRLAQRLLHDGWDVHVIIRPGSHLDLLHPLRTAVTVHEHDGSTEGMISLVSRAKPSTVFHLASLFLAQHQAGDIEPLIRSNILFGTQLVEAMAVNRTFALVNTGTSWQHYENKQYGPVCLYAATKQAYEAILGFYANTTELKVITLKLFDTYGPEDPRPKLFTLLRKTAAHQQTLAMSPGEQLIDLVYIDDIVDAFFIAAERLLQGRVSRYEAYAVSSGNPVRLRDLVELYGRIIGKVLPLEWGKRPYRPREVMIPWNTGNSLPGWKPKIGLEEGIKRMEGLSTS